MLILSERADETDVVVALDAGADAYVSKPFRLAELLARVRALLRPGLLSHNEGGDCSVTIDSKARRVFHHGQELSLRAKEFDLLQALVHQRGQVVTRETLLQDVWGRRSGSTKTLDMHISTLRHRLGEDASHPSLIVTLPGVGYRFQCEPTNDYLDRME